MSPRLRALCHDTNVTADVLFRNLTSCFGQGGSYDSELMRVLRERDEMQNMLDKYERHLSEIQANVKVLTADRDKTSMHHQQASTILKGIVNSNKTHFVRLFLLSVPNEWEIILLITIPFLIRPSRR